jgi:hypothetical protein
MADADAVNDPGWLLGVNIGSAGVTWDLGSKEGGTW